MKRFIFSVLFVCLSATFANAGLFDACSPCGPTGCGSRKSLFDSLQFYGWVQGGVYTNAWGATTQRYRTINYDGREVSRIENGNGWPLGALQSTDFQVNQIWFGLKKEFDTTHGFDWGFRSDVLFGTDGWFSQSWADAGFDYGWQDGDYYLSLPQLFVEFGFRNLSVKVGKFETLLGYEAFQAPDFFFFSHSYAYLSEPYSHSGALFTYKVNDKITATLGYTTGWDATLENRYDDHGLIGSVSLQATDKLSLSYVYTYTRFGNEIPAEPNHEIDRSFMTGCDKFFHTFVASYDITKKLNYAIQWNLGDSNRRDDAYRFTCYGLTNYLTYRFNDRWGAGFRFEWFRNNEDYGVGGKFRGDLYEYTLGLNWTPIGNLSIRPEIRYDSVHGDLYDAPFKEGTKRDQFSGGVCGVYSF